jgi:hypothetical protein
MELNRTINVMSGYAYFVFSFSRTDLGLREICACRVSDG